MDFFNARWYDGRLGRFVEADSIIPEASQGTQAWDRYAGMNNNPTRFIDPSGHMTDDGCRSLGCTAKNGEEYRDYIYGEVYRDVDRQANAEAVEYYSTFTFTLFAPPPIAVIYQILNDQPVSAFDVAGVAIPALSGVGDAVSVSHPLYRWVAATSHTDNIPWSSAFKDATMSVFDGTKGATPELVMDVLGNGSGSVYTLEYAQVLDVSGVSGIIDTIGGTGNQILDQSHMEIINSGSNSIAKVLRNIATLVLSSGIK